jgi:hypothetical protein
MNCHTFHTNYTIIINRLQVFSPKIKESLINNNNIQVDKKPYLLAFHFFPSSVFNLCKISDRL